MALKLCNRTYYSWLFLVLAASVLATAMSVPVETRLTVVLPLTAALTGFIYFLYRQHLDETKLFKDLFVEFNARYDRLNERLNRILLSPDTGPITDWEKDALFDYFNLCAEEFLFYRAGYIDEEVWRSWRRGMDVFAENPRIRAEWERELKTDSYYGFQLD